MIFRIERKISNITEVSLNQHGESDVGLLVNGILVMTLYGATGRLCAHTLSEHETGICGLEADSDGRVEIDHRIPDPNDDS